MTRARSKSVMPPQQRPNGGVSNSGEGPLDRLALRGRYEVDAVLGQIKTLEIEDQSGSVRLDLTLGALRGAVNRIAFRARNNETALRGSIERAKEARDHFEYLRTLADGLRVLPDHRLETIHYMVDRTGFEIAEEDDRPHRTLQNFAGDIFQRMKLINRASEALKIELRRFLDEHETLPAHNSGNSSPLEQAFVEYASIWWEAVTGKPPGRTRGGLFASFLGAAWRDLDFPPIEDADEALGRIYENSSEARMPPKSNPKPKRKKV